MGVCRRMEEGKGVRRWMEGLKVRRKVDVVNKREKEEVEWKVRMEMGGSGKEKRRMG